MIFITGDVHAYRKNDWEQKKASNVAASLEYLKILKKSNLSCTLFINGKCIENEKEDVKKLLEYDAEFGGHTYNNFGNLGVVRSYIFRKIFGCIYGPNFYQRRDIKKTKKAFEKFGLKMTSWRTHAFGSNNRTFEVLSENKVKFVSDLLGNKKPFLENGIIHLPVNIPVDQNTIAYGMLSPENRNAFASCTKGRINPEEWFDILKKRVIENEKKNIPSIILIHPATMKELDNFKLFEKICKFLSRFESRKISDFSNK